MTAHSSGSLFSRLEPVFRQRDGALLCILVQLIFMYAVGCLASFFISHLSPRTNSLPERRQKQLATAVPVIVLKAGIMVLIVDILLATPYPWSSNYAIATAPSVEYRFEVLYFIAISYMFEILQRPSSLELVLHHLYLQGLPFYYCFWLSVRPFAHADLVMRFFELMVLLGPGATDITSDITFLLYYCAPRSQPGLAVTAAMSWIATLMRAVQWTVLIGYGYARYNDARLLLSSTEKAVFMLSVVLWVWTEIDEILKIRGMVGKFRQSLKQKSS